MAIYPRIFQQNWHIFCLGWPKNKLIYNLRNSACQRVAVRLGPSWWGGRSSTGMSLVVLINHFIVRDFNGQVKVNPLLTCLRNKLMALYRLLKFGNVTTFVLALPVNSMYQVLIVADPLASYQLYSPIWGGGEIHCWQRWYYPVFGNELIVVQVESFVSQE